VALDDLAAHAEDDALDARLLGLFGDRLQRLLERQAGVQQGRELAGQQRQIERREPRRMKPRARLCFCSLCAASWIVHRQQLLLAQQLAHVLRGVAFDQPLALLALRIERGVFERAHQSSRVTRRTSSSVVSPASTLRRPSSRMPGLDVRA
jgi:hypothetical protein